MASRVRIKLAKQVEKEMLEQFGIVVEVNPETAFSIPTGWYRTDIHSDTYRWTCQTSHPRPERRGPMIDCYDTMTESARHGFFLIKDSRRNSYDATARNKN